MSMLIFMNLSMTTHAWELSVHLPLQSFQTTQLCFPSGCGSVFHTDQEDPSSSDDEGMPYTRPAKFKAAHSFKGPFDFDQIKVVQDLSGEHMVRSSAFLFTFVYLLYMLVLLHLHLFDRGLFGP